MCLNWLICLLQNNSCCLIFIPLGAAAVGAPEDVALYVGVVAVAVFLVLLLAVILVCWRRKEGLDADVADSSILTAAFQPVSLKPGKAGEAPQENTASSKCILLLLGTFVSCVKAVCMHSSNRHSVIVMPEQDIIRGKQTKIISDHWLAA